MLDRHRYRAAAVIGLVLAGMCACDGSADPRRDAAADLVSGADAEPEPDDGAASPPDADAEVDADAEIDGGPQHDADADAVSATDADAEVDAEVDAVSDTDAGPCAPSECPSPDPCLAASCAPEGGCQLALAPSDACCFDRVLLAEDAESPDTASQISDLAPSSAPAIRWNRSAHRAFTGAFGWYFGDPSALNFDNGERVAGRLELSPVTLPSDRLARLIFHVYADVEAGPTWDLLVVRVATPDSSTPVFVKDAGFTVDGWQRVSVDLAAFAGRTVSIQFDFDSVEATLNDTEGLTLDAIWVLTDCEVAPGCAAAPDCDDALACTVETCSDNRCAYTPRAGCCALESDCDDGDACTHDACVAGACSHSAQSAPGCCDCDDADACTIDTCLDGTCSYAPSTALACCEPTALAETFDDPFTAWTFTGTPGDCAWYIEIKPTSPPGGAATALVYGNGANYDCGLTSGVARSPSLTLTAGVRWTLQARVWLQTEVPTSVDILSLFAVTATGLEVELWTKPAGPGAQQKWLTIARDLSAFGGLEITLQWRFDTADDKNNDLAGPRVDSISLTSTCAPRTCAAPADCDDALAATTEACVDGACVFTLPTP